MIRTLFAVGQHPLTQYFLSDASAMNYARLHAENSPVQTVHVCIDLCEDIVIRLDNGAHEDTPLGIRVRLGARPVFVYEEIEYGTHELGDAESAMLETAYLFGYTVQGFPELPILKGD